MKDWIKFWQERMEYWSLGHVSINPAWFRNK